MAAYPFGVNVSEITFAVYSQKPNRKFHVYEWTIKKKDVLLNPYLLEFFWDANGVVPFCLALSP